MFFAGGAVGRTIVGGAGNETLAGGGSTGNNTFIAGAGSQLPQSSNGNDSLQGGSGSLAGARVLAGQLHEALERRHAVAAARVGRSPAFPFNLDALVPVPTDHVIDFMLAGLDRNDF